MRSVLLALVLLCAAAPAAQADLVSRFDAGPDGWTVPVEGSSTSVPAPWAAAGHLSLTSDGGQYLQSFFPPTSWYGDRRGSLGRRLSFDIRVESVNTTVPVPFVTLSGGGGSFLSYRTLPTASPNFQHIDLLLDEGGGWTNQAGQPATRADFENALSSASFGIRAEFDTTGTTLLDNVVFEEATSDLSLSVNGTSSVPEDGSGTSTITVTNNGPDAVRSASLSFSSPVGPFAGITAPAGSTCTQVPNICTVGAIPAGASQTWALTWKADGIVGRRSLLASVRSTSSVDPNAANDTASMSVLFTAAAGSGRTRQLPPPKVGKSVNVAVVSGKVRVREPGKKTYRLLGPGEQLPVGTSLDLSAGRIALTVAVNAAGKTETSQFYGGGATVTQSKGALPVTELRLDVKLSCKRASSAAGKKTKKNSLWGDGKGSFRTRGRYGSAAVRGTKWLTRDQCGATLVKVSQGSVLVRDFAKRRNVVVRAGRSYLAKVKRR